MRRAVHADTASFGPLPRATLSFVGSRSPVQLASDASSLRALPETRDQTRDQDRFLRRLVKSNGFDDPKRLQLTGVLLRARDRSVDVAADAPFLPLRHPNPQRGLELDRASAFSRNRTRLHQSERHLSESASSQKHEHDSRNVRTSRAGAPFQHRRVAPSGAASRETPD